MSIDTERAQARTVDYNKYLARQLHNAQSRIKAVDLVTGGVIVAVGVVAYTLSVIMLDQIFTLSMGMRIGLLGLFSVATAGYLVHAVVLPAARRINPLYAARRVESVAPEAKNSIVNWFLLRENRDEIPEPIMRAIEARAASDLSKIDLGEAIDTKHILRASYALAAVVVSFCVFLFFTTKELTPSLKRVLFPLAEIAPPTETKLTQIEPGNSDIAAGDKITISAYASGKEPSAITLYASSDNGEYWEPIPLEKPVEKYGRWQVTLNDRQKSFDYYLTANDFRSPTYRVRVSAAPLVTDWEVTYHFPSYTGEPKRSEKGGDIDALEGTTVELEVTTNVPVRPDSGRIEWTLGKNRSTLKLDLVSGSENRLLGKWSLSEEGSYQVSFDDLLGRKPQFKPVKSIRVRKDTSPVLGFVEPVEPRVEKPANARFPIRLSASDDYGLAKVRFHLEREQDGRVLLDEELRVGDEPLGRSRLFVMPIDLGKLGVKAGDLLNYWAEGEDNKLPVSNLVSTQDQPRTIAVIEPPKPQPNEPPEPDRNQEPGNERNSTPNAEPNEKGNDPKNQKQPSGDQKNPPKQGEPGEQNPQEGDGEKNDQGAPSPSGKSDSKSADSSKSEQPNPQGDGESPRERTTESKEGANQSSDDSNQPEEPLDDEDRQSLDKLKDYFDRKRDSKESSPKEKQESDAAKQDKGPKKDHGSTEGKQKPEPKTKDGTEKQKDSSEKPSSDVSESKNEENKKSGDQGQKPNDSHQGKNGESEKQPSKEEKPAGGEESKENAASKSSKESAEKGEERSVEKPAALKDEQKPGKEGKNASQAEKEKVEKASDKSRRDSKESSEEGSKPDGQPKEGKAEEKSKPTKETKQDNSSEPSTEKSEKSESEGAGKEGNKPSEKPMDSASSPQDGEPSPKDQGKESSQGENQQPKPSTDQQPMDQQNPKGSKKEGDQNSAANENSNSEGQSSQGESSKSGESSTGSPSEKVGDNPNSSGEQQGEGQSPKPGESKNPSEGKEGSESPEKGSNSDKQDSAKKEGKSSNDSSKSSEQDQSKDGKGSKESGSESKSSDSTQGSESKSGSSSKGETPSKQETESKGQGEDKGGTQPSNAPPGAKSNTSSEGKEDQGLEAGGDNVIDNTGEAADVGDKKKASELVLKKLQDELKKKKIDPELLKELGWTEQDAREFAKRMEKSAAPKETPANPLTGKDREGFGKGTPLRKSASRAAGAIPQDTQQDLFQGSRAAPPPEYRELYEAYTRSLSKTGKAQTPENNANPPATGKRQ